MYIEWTEYFLVHPAVTIFKSSHSFLSWWTGKIDGKWRLFNTCNYSTASDFKTWAANLPTIYNLMQCRTCSCLKNSPFKLAWPPTFSIVYHFSYSLSISWLYGQDSYGNGMILNMLRSYKINFLIISEMNKVYLLANVNGFVSKFVVSVFETWPS